MWVCDCLILGRRMGIDGHHIVRRLVIQLGELLEVQGNTEAPEIYALQGDRIGHDAQCPFLSVECHIIELVPQTSQLIDDGAKAWNLLGPSVQETL